MNFKIEDSSDSSLIAVRSKVKRDAAKETAKLFSTNVLNTLLSLAVVVVLWVFSLWAFDVSPYIGKGPLDVFEYLFIEDAAEHQQLVLSALGQTLIDASIGFSFGLFFATFI